MATATPTPRQQEIINLLSEGKTHTEITTLLGLKDSGLQSHLARMKKAGLLDRGSRPIVASTNGNGPAAVDLSGTGGTPPAEDETVDSRPPIEDRINISLKMTLEDIDAEVARNTETIKSSGDQIDKLREIVEQTERANETLVNRRDSLAALLPGA
jgi:hypothetical protein